MVKSETQKRPVIPSGRCIKEGDRGKHDLIREKPWGMILI